MSGGPTLVRPFGRWALLAEVGDQAGVHRLFHGLRAALAAGAEELAGVEEVVAGARTVLVVGNPGRTDLGRVGSLVPRWAAEGRPDAPALRREVSIPVVYDGPDLDEVGRLTGLDPAGVAGRHSAGRYTVGFVGFSPGFAYLVGGDPVLDVPRRPEPRARVPAGSVGLAAGMTAVYPTAMPGGWRLIGRTDAVMFDGARQDPCLVGPGDRVRFRPATRVVGPEGAGRGDAATARAGRGGSARAGGPLAVVLRPGPRTTVQDAGRVGHAHEGVPRAGAADSVSLARANRLVGNPPGAAALETTLAGPALRFTRDTLVAVAGADLPVTVDGAPVDGWPTVVPAGSVLDLGSARRGLRGYLAVAGGVAVAPVLGSRSSDTLSGLGPPPLARDDAVPLGGQGAPGSGAIRGARGPAVPGPAALPGTSVTVRLLPGPRVEWLGPEGLGRLAAAELAVSPVSDRTGLRLEGGPVDPVPLGSLPSEGMVAGAVQLPPAGSPIVLMCNHATTGGYPAVAVVEPDDLPLLAQARPGCRVRFEPVE